MKTNKPLTRSLLAILPCLMGILIAPTAAEDQMPPLHPPVPLLDSAGQAVVKTARPISTMRTCGACHDTDYIVAHSFHVSVGSDEQFPLKSQSDRRPWDYSPGLFGRWNPIFYRYLTPPDGERLDLGTAQWIQLQGWRHVGGGPALHGHGNVRLDQRPDNAPKDKNIDPDMQILDTAARNVTAWDWNRSGVVEMNCFLCHMDTPDNSARLDALASGQFQWANTATLGKTDLVQQAGDHWTYNAKAFADDGSVKPETLQLGPPTSRHCGQCHGQTHQGSEPLQLDLTVRAWSTATKGQVYSSQRIFESAINLRNKQQLTRPWDAHAQALLNCKDCHFSLNNPAAYEPSRADRPRHLRHEPRRLSVAEFLRKPNHQFAKGETAQGTVARHLDGTMRRCDECHNAEATHDWLPYQKVHFMRLSCEACHVDRSFAPALRQIDWTVLTTDGDPVTQWRGIEGSVNDPVAEVTGFRPVMLQRKELDDRQSLGPFNLVSSWYWVEETPEGPRPVRQADLQAALLDGKNYHPVVIAALDTDGNGVVDPLELRLDGEPKVTVVRDRLKAVGVKQPHIEAEVQPYGMHHGVGPARTAVQQCESCHSAQSRLGQPFLLASYVPGNVTPKLVVDADVTLNGSMLTDADGQLVFEPSTRDVGLYVLGHDYWSWINRLGLLVLVGTILGVSIHGGLRIRTTRHGNGNHASATRPNHTPTNRTPQES